MSDDPIDRLEAGAQKAEDAWRAGDFAAALGHYAEAVAERLANSAYGVDPHEKLQAADFVVFERLADLARLFGRAEEADELLEISVGQIAEAGNRYWADLLHVKRIDLALGRGCLGAAQSLLDAMSPSIGDVRRIRFSDAGLKEWERQCRWPDADGRDRTTIFALLYFVMGRLLASLGQYGQAEAALLRGLEHAGAGAVGGRAYEGAPEIARQVASPLALALAATLLEKGELSRAAGYLDRLQAEVSEEKRPSLFVQRLELRGRLGLLSGDFGPALAAFRRVLELCARRGFARAEVAAALNLAHVLILLNQTLDASRYLLPAREFARQSGDLASVARAEWLLRLARARAQSLADSVPLGQTVTEQWGHLGTQRRQQPLEATPNPADDAPPEESAFTDGLNPFDLPQSDNYLSYFEESALGFHWLLGRRDFDACAAYLAQLQKIFAPTDSGLIGLRLRVLSGLLAYYRDEFARAEEVLADAQEGLRELGMLPELWQAQRLLGWSRAKLGRGDAAQEELAAENSTLLGVMADSLAQEDRGFFLLNKWTAEEEELAVGINRLSRMKADIARAPWRRRLRLRRQLAAEVEALSRVVDRYRHVAARLATRTHDGGAGGETGADRHGPPDARPETLWRRVLRRRRRRATLSFLVLPDRVLVVRHGRLKPDFIVSPATRVEVRELVRRWHEVIRQLTEVRARDLGHLPDEPPATGEGTTASAAALSEEARRIAEELSALLRLPSVLDGLPRRTRALTIVPDDILHGFPFAAIRHGGHYLVERYALAFAYRGDGAEEQQQQPGDGRRALLVGASRGGGGWSELKFVPEELDGVAGWAAGRRLSVERLDDAEPAAGPPDKAAVLAALPQSTLAHVACHGLFTPDDPTRSGIVLRPARRPGVLSVRELSALDLTRLRHVTLSACWSADHFILPGRWVISLPETLARAGAASVLGCLWVVDDRVGTAFMKQFYRRLDTHTRAEALRLTQHECLKGTLEGAKGPETAHPIYWAGYQLYGRPDALKL